MTMDETLKARVAAALRVYGADANVDEWAAWWGAERMTDEELQECIVKNEADVVLVEGIVAVLKAEQRRRAA